MWFGAAAAIPPVRNGLFKYLRTSACAILFLIFRSIHTMMNGFIVFLFIYLSINKIWFLPFRLVSINRGANVGHPNGWMERFAVVHFGGNCIVYHTMAFAAFGRNQRHRRTIHCLCFDGAHHHCASTLWTGSGNYIILYFCKQYVIIPRFMCLVVMRIIIC